MRIEDHYKSHFLLFLSGIFAGVLCRLSDFFPYKSLWSFSSIATLFGFWIASVGAITLFSSSNKGAFINTFLYMFGMTTSFYGLKYILGHFSPRFADDGFQTNLFVIYSLLSVVCGIGSFILYYWNGNHKISSVLCALPAAGMLSEAAGCLFVLINRHMLLAQTLFDIAFALAFGIVLFKKADNKLLYFISMLVAALVVFLFVYKPFLLTI